MPLPVGVTQVHRDRRAVVLGPIDGVAMVEQTPHGATQFAAVGVDDGEVMEPRVSVRRRSSALARPRVQADVMVVASGGQKRRPGQAEVRPVGDNVEAQHVVSQKVRTGPTRGTHGGADDTP